MIICEVIGHVWATKKESSLEGFKLMVVQETDKTARIFVAVDIVGAGIGEQVLVVRGSTARRAGGKDALPIDAAIVGIIDSVEIYRSKEKTKSKPSSPKKTTIQVKRMEAAGSPPEKTNDDQR